MHRRRYGLFFAWPPPTRAAAVALVGTLAALLFRTPALAADKEALAAVDDGWSFYQSPNFELYSRNSEGESREFLHELELLRAVFTDRFNLVPRVRLDVTAYYFRDVEDLHAYAKRKNIGGYYLNGLDRAVIAVAPSDELEGEREIVFHEYVHHLFREDGLNPPPWFDEGMAELLAPLKLQGDMVEIGWPQPGRLAVVHTEKLLPLDQLFTVDRRSPIYESDDHIGIFYAESWALLHYLYFGNSSFPADVVARFTRVAGDETAVKTVNLPVFFRECFGIDYAEMQRRMQRYVESGRFHVIHQAAPKIPPAGSYTMRRVTRDEIRIRLAELALRTTRSAAARLMLLQAAGVTPVDPRVLEVLGTDARFDNDETTSRERWERAITAGSHNVAVFRELGLMESRQWFEGDFNYDFRLPEDTAERLRRRLRMSIEYEPRQTGAYEMLAWVEAYAATPVAANVNLVQREFGQLTEKQRTVVALAMVRAHLGKPAEAKAVLAQLPKLPPEPWSAYAAEVVRAKLEGRSIAGIRPRTGREETVDVTATSRPGLPYPSVVLPEGL